MHNNTKQTEKRAMTTRTGTIRGLGRICGLLLPLLCLCVLLSGCTKKYEVTFDTNGGRLVAGELVQTIKEGESAVAPTVRNGKQRLSWDTDFSNITGDTVVTAQWAPPIYTVRFDLNGGTLVSGETEQLVEEGSAASAPEVEIEGQRLTWNRDFSNITGDTVVTAQWEPITYTVRFDLNGGELISGEVEQVVNAGEAAIAPEAKNGIRQLNWDKDFSSVSDDLVVTAQWQKVKLDTADLAEYVQARTVTINATTLSGRSVSGSGFFIDDNGTLVTNWHVIEATTDISVMVDSGAKYDVTRIVDFSEICDLAILKIEFRGSQYLELSEEAARAGEKVYAVGSALGTLTGSFTSGIISSTKRTIGSVEYLQMDAAISHGNSGGPLVNEYGDVVGVNTLSYANGENLNMAIKIETLSKLKRDKNWSMREFNEWYAAETARSYDPWDDDGNYYYSTINTYQTITGRECFASISGGNAEEGYVSCYEKYVYDYDAKEYDQYVEYLKELDFAYYKGQTTNGDIVTSYYREKDGILMVFIVNTVDSYLVVSACQL